MEMTDAATVVLGGDEDVEVLAEAAVVGDAIFCDGKCCVGFCGCGGAG